MKRTTHGLRFVVISLLALGVVARQAEARKGLHIKQNLTVTGVDPDARGQAQVMLGQSPTGMRGRLIVKAARLDPDAVFEVDLQGVRIGTLTTTGGGSGRAVFNTQPNGHDQLLGVDPRGKTVELKDASGNNVLEAKVPDDTVDPTQIRCCLSHGNEQPECESATADQCMAAGGVNQGAGSCLPNPCASSTPPASGNDVVCCKPDDNGAECDQSGKAECSNEGGISLGAGSCDPNPCTSTTPQNPETVQCCLSGDSHDSEVECEQRTPDTCKAQGGTDMGASTCHPNPCTQTPAGDQIRCCSAGDSGHAECEERTADECMAHGGTNAGPGVCDANACSSSSPTPTSEQGKIRCCVTKDSEGTECEDRTPDECIAHGGMDIGAGSCEPNPCGQ